MNKDIINKRVWTLIILVLSTCGFALGKPALVSLTPEGKKLEGQYGKMMNDLQDSIR